MPLESELMLDRIGEGRTDLVFEYLGSGGSPEAEANGVPLINWCAYYGDVSAVRHLLDKGEKLESLGQNLNLNGAAFHGHWRLCEFLIENGADPNQPLPDTGETPLHAAVSRAQYAAQDLVVALLLDAGADPGSATLANRPTGCFMRDTRTRGETPLHRAAAFAAQTSIQSLLDHGGDRATRDMHGDTPLSWASWHVRPSAILRLLCYDGFAIHPDASWIGDHGSGFSGMDKNLLGRHILRR